MAPARLSRKERQARTRSSLIRSAARVFCRRGLDRGSIDEVAEEAGYTKGAFYANFRSKEELFLTMLDERFAEKIEEADRAFADTAESPPDQARHAAADFAQSLRSDPEVARLFQEFYAYAIRNDGFREELVTRFTTLRERLESVYQRRADAYGLELSVPMERIVRMVIAMSDGWALWQLLEPDQVDEKVFEEMMAIFTTGIGAMGGALDRAEAAR
jgi:AcrR family transcriptional regulator